MKSKPCAFLYISHFSSNILIFLSWKIEIKVIKIMIYAIDFTKVSWPETNLNHTLTLIYIVRYQEKQEIWILEMSCKKSTLWFSLLLKVIAATINLLIIVLHNIKTFWMRIKSSKNLSRKCCNKIILFLFISTISYSTEEGNP